jgi:hypothetical protein
MNLQPDPLQLPGHIVFNGDLEVKHDISGPMAVRLV